MFFFPRMVEMLKKISRCCPFIRENPFIVHPLQIPIWDFRHVSSSYLWHRSFQHGSFLDACSRFSLKNRLKLLNFPLVFQVIAVCLYLLDRFSPFGRFNTEVNPQGAAPPHPFLYAKRRQVEIIWTGKIPPSSPLGYASDIAKPLSNLCQAALLRRCELPL